MAVMLYVLFNKHDDAVAAVVSRKDVADRWRAQSPMQVIDAFLRDVPTGGGPSFHEVREVKTRHNLIVKRRKVDDLKIKAGGETVNERHIYYRILDERSDSDRVDCRRLQPRRYGYNEPYSNHFVAPKK